jgi:hypothetical protein
MAAAGIRVKHHVAVAYLHGIFPGALHVSTNVSSL